MTLDYSKKTMQQFFKPKNFGKIKNPDAIGEVRNEICGDVMEMHLKIDAKTSIIKDIKFQTYGCIAAIASTSMLTQLVKGKTIEQAQKLTMYDIKNALHDLPKIKIHCSSMAIQVLKKAIENYKENHKEINMKKQNGK